MSPWLVLLLAMTPGLLAWWRGRPLGATPDETVAERFFAHRREVAAIGASASALVVLLAGIHATWALPLLVLGLLRGSYPARKSVLHEAWGFAAYASHMLRFAAAGAGFFVLLAATPALVAALGPASRLPLAIVLVAWAAGSHTVFLALARARPLDRPDLAPLLERVLRRSRVAPPTLHRAGPRGGRMVNAFALPALPRPSVLFTDDLLEFFPADEVAAVFAHEVAHLEHFGRRRLWLRALAMLALVALAAFVAPHVAARLPAVASWIPALWALAVAIAAPAALAAHRGHEGASDRRAAELCGDPEALVRALVKLHALAALPRRYSLEVEGGSTHPSLARRIQAIRQASGAPPEVLPAPAVLPGEQPGTFVVLENERAHWLEGAPPELAGEPVALRLGAARVESSAYSDLADLHLEAGRGGVVLVARAVAGKKRRFRLRGDAAAAAQAALDAVDARLAPAPVGWALPVVLGPLAAAGLVCGSLLGGHPFLVGPPAAVALWRTGPAPLAASGTAAVAAAVLSWLSPAGDTAARALSLGVLGLAGLVSLLVAGGLWRAPSGRSRGVRPVLVVLALQAALAVLGLAAAAALGPPLLRLHQAAAGSAAAAALLGLGVALVLSDRAPARRLAALPALAAVLVALVGSDRFADRLVSDPLLAPTAVLRETSVSLTPLAIHRFRGPAAEARLSPGGGAFAVRGWNEENAEEWPRFRVGAAGREPREIEALDLRFVDDERALVLSRPGESRTELRLVRLFTPGEPEWRLDVGALVLPSLEVAEAQGRWQVAGTDHEARQARLVSGSLAGGPVTETLLALPEGSPSPIVFGAGGGIAQRSRLSSLATRGGLLPLLPLLFRGGIDYPLETEIVLLTRGGPRPMGVTGLELQCVSQSLESALHCLAYDGARTILWERGPSAGGLEPRGSVRGRITAVQAHDGQVLAYGPRLEPVLLRPREGALVRLRVDAVGMPALAPGGRVLGVLRDEGPGGTLAVFGLP
jgi:Zn-dependent protease with chaperone function